MSNAPEAKQPPEQIVLQMVIGKWVSQAMTVAAELGVADQLGDDSLSSETLAERVDAHPESLYRLLRALAGVGIFKESEGRVFSNSELSDKLREDAEGSMRAMVRWVGEDAVWRAWAKLGHSVRTGQPGFDAMFGNDFFSYAGANPSTLERFQAAMTGFSVGTGQAVADTYDFSGIRSLVDVGGGHGAMLSSIVAGTPELRGVLFDLPEVIAEAKKGLVDHAHAARIQTEAGSFLERVPEGHDAYIMKFIIHDWSDEHSVQILSHCRKAMKPDGRVLIVEQLLDEGESASFTKLIDLEMLLLTPGGRERTLKQFEGLLAAAGLKIAQVVPTPSIVKVIEARPA